MPYNKLLHTYLADQPEVHDIVAEMRQVVESYGERLLIGEIYLPIDRLVTYYGGDGAGAHLPFDFGLVERPWEAREISALIDHYEGASPEGAGPTGCWATMTNPESPLEPGRRRRGWRRCCC